jgi:transcriptional regulator with XRE-family HTH domain
MKNEKKSTFVYQDLGVPIKLMTAPMKKICGEWVLDLDMELLQRIVLEAIIHKQSLLTGLEIRYIRKYMYLSVEEFGKTFGVTHAAVSKWENSKNGISPSLDVCIRLHIMEYLKVKDVEFRKLYRDLDLSKLSKEKKVKLFPLIIDAVDPKNLRIA